MMKEKGLRYQFHEFKSWFEGLREILNSWEDCRVDTWNMLFQAVKSRHQERNDSSFSPGPLAVFGFWPSDEGGSGVSHLQSWLLKALQTLQIPLSLLL